MKGVFSLDEAQRASVVLCTSLMQHCSHLVVCGSVRRRKPIVHDLDVIVAEPTARFFEVLAIMGGRWVNKGGEIVVNGVPAQVEMMPIETWGAALCYRTGSKEENVRLRAKAVSMGFKLSQYGVRRRDNNELLGGRTEEEVYELLNEPYVRPEDR